jgi:hypothetical protein
MQAAMNTVSPMAPRHATAAEKSTAHLLATVAGGMLAALIAAAAASAGVLAETAAWAKAVVLLLGVAACVLLVASGWIGLYGSSYRVIVPGPGNKFDLQAKILLAAVFMAVLAVTVAVATAAEKSTAADTGTPSETVLQRLDDLERRIDRRFVHYDRSTEELRALGMAVESLRKDVQALTESMANPGDSGSKPQ